MAEGQGEHNPYAAPEEEAEEPRRRGRTSSLEAERRPVGICVLLGVVTLGVYPAIWLFKRRAFLDGLDTPHKLGTALPSTIIVAYALSVVVMFAGKEGESISRALSLAGGVAALIASFRVAAILRAEYARTGRYVDLGSAWVFLFGVYYLQYKINQGADARPLRERKKKKKRKKSEGERAREGEGEGARDEAS